MINFSSYNFDKIKANKYKDRKGFLCLDLNENKKIIDEKIILSYFNDFDSSILYNYPYYEDIIDKLSFYVGIDRNNILITNGSSQAIDIAVRGLFNKEDTVLIVSPTFLLYKQILDFIGCNVVNSNYLYKDNNLVFPIEDILKNIKNKDIDGVILCNPNNPLGNLIPKDNIYEILKFTRDKNIPCIIDEAYFEFSKATYKDLIEDYDNLIIIRTFSKFLGIAGLRFGFLLAQKYIIDSFKKIRGRHDVNSFSVFIVDKMLNSNNLLLSAVEDFNYRKMYFKKRLTELGITVIDCHTNFLLIKSKNSNILSQKLLENKILVNDLSNYQDSNGILDNILRVSVPTIEDIDFFIGVLEKMDIDSLKL